ncbi:MAG: peptidylprolyl isomerase [Anaerolineae bacterium]|nr:peptidylprolyl isomerase [Anaerolineae bacterium]MDQ7033378.1 peptidylprolyl isomerase [Anaerolineae bacterium]
MAKRRQTTGQPKKNRNKDNKPLETTFFNRLLGSPTNRTEYNDALNQFIRRGAFAILGAITAIIAFALIYNFVFVPLRPVATVNGEDISVSEFRERIRLEQALVLQQAQSRYAQVAQFVGDQGDPNQFLRQDQQYQQWTRELQLVDILGQRVLDDMINDVLIRQEAEARGITIDDGAVQNQVNTYFGYDPTEVALIGTPATETPLPDPTNTPFVSPTPSPSPLPTSTPMATATPEATAEVEATDDVEATAEVSAEATDDVGATATLPPVPTQSQEDRLDDFDTAVDLFRQNIRDTASVSNEAIDALFERQAWRNALLEAVVTIDDMATFANVRHILVETEEEANELIAALQNGESFASLAQARSIDTGSGQRGGELGWAAVSSYVPEFEAAILSAEIGEIVGPVESEFGFHILQIRAREEREIEGTERDNLRQTEFARWVENLRAENEENITTNDNWPDFLPTN